MQYSLARGGSSVNVEYVGHSLVKGESGVNVEYVGHSLAWGESGINVEYVRHSLSSRGGQCKCKVCRAQHDKLFNIIKSNQSNFLY